MVMVMVRMKSPGRGGRLLRMAKGVIRAGVEWAESTTAMHLRRGCRPKSDVQVKSRP
jgi:hypothetical protein